MASQTSTPDQAVGGGGLPPPQPLAADHSHTHPWFAERVAALDRQEMPAAVAEKLLRNTEFQPGKRPASVVGAVGACTLASMQSVCLSRSQRVFKEMAPQGRRTKAVDRWRNAGGRRSQKAIPNAESPVLWRRYGAVYAPIQLAGGGTESMAVYTYHEYTLAEDQKQLQHPVLFHVFLTKAVSQQMVNALTPVNQPHAYQGSLPGPWRGPASACAAHLTPATLETPPKALVTVDSTALSTQRTAYITFEKSGRSLGEVAKTQSEGILMTSRAGDFAERHEVNDDDGQVNDGDIVAIVDGRLSRRGTATAQMLGVVSNKAMLEGSAAKPGDNRQHRSVAYAGRVPVNVRGLCQPGDRITFSGLEDGTGIRATSWCQPSVGKVLATGTPPDLAGKAWQVEIAVTPPGTADVSFGSNRVDTRCRFAGYKRLSLAVLVLVALATCMVHTGAGMQQMPRHKPANQPNPHGSSQPADPARSGGDACGKSGWLEVQNICSADYKRFELFSMDFLDGHYTLMFQTVQHIDHLNLAGLGVVWGSGICSANSSVHSSPSPWLPTLSIDAPTGVSECALALRTYLDSCPDGPLLGLSTNATNASGTPTTNAPELEPGGARQLSPSEKYLRSCVGLRCAGTLDLLFAQQCLSEAFPGMFNITRTLALSTTPAKSNGDVAGHWGTESADAVEKHSFKSIHANAPHGDSVSSHGTETAAALTGKANMPASLADQMKSWQQCASATKLMFSECNACNSADCSGNFENDVAQPVTTCDSNSANGANRSTLSKTSGCSCQCFAKGTNCAGAMLEALRVSARVHSGGCSALQARFRSDTGMEQVGAGRMPSAAALTVMLYSAQGVRDIPTY